MIRRLPVILLLITISFGLGALTDTYYENIPLEELFRIYGVPEVPAYMVLGVEPSSTLPPIDDNGMSVSISDLASGTTIIPETFALEIAPLLLYKKDITLQDYHRSPIFFNSRLSLATTGLDDGRRKASLGLRLKLIDRADPKGNFNRAWPQFFEDYFRAQQSYLNAELYADPDLADDPDALEALMSQFDDDYGINAKLQEMIQDNKDKWNKLRIEFSTAVVAVSPDSLASKARFEAWQNWFSLSNSLLGSTTAQYIFSPSVRYFRDEGENHLSVFAPLRFVLKSPLINSYLELQYSHDGWLAENFGSGTLGLYFQLQKGLWVDYQASFSVDLDSGASDLDHNLKLKYTLPLFLQN
ncbi:MAG: hypothetical protein K0B87_00845 [Candidatus Syntrophosphaera sp.]|nr:hypothetical protein [Candidatus Syntrophosphaera sp.]